MHCKRTAVGVAFTIRALAAVRGVPRDGGARIEGLPMVPMPVQIEIDDFCGVRLDNKGIRIDALS